VVDGTTQPASNDPGWAGSPPATWNLGSGDGSREVTVFARDLAGNVGSQTRTIVLDTAAPTASLSVTSPSGSRTVSVTVGGGDGPVGSGITHYAVIEGTTAPSVGSAAWVATPPTAFLVSDGDGTKTLSAFTRDAAGLVSTAATKTVLLDTTRPTAILTAPTTTSSVTVAITVTGSDGSGSGITAWAVVEGTTAPVAGHAAWVGSSPTSFTLSSGLGPRTVSAFTRDAVGNVSLASSVTVTLQAP
jgi:hypothetical protein